jgi:formate dehydrogenase subunit gamma
MAACPRSAAIMSESLTWARRHSPSKTPVNAPEAPLPTLLLARLRFLAGIIAIFIVLAAALPSSAQPINPDGTPNPTAAATDQQTLLKQLPRVEGRIAIPDQREGVLEQPAGRLWAYFHEVILRWLGTIVILGMIAVLAIWYLIMGRLRISAGRSGIPMLRFTTFERLSHWLTAVSFVLLALTGLNITFGRPLLLPWLGPDTFSTVSEAAKYVHNFVSFGFVIGLLLIVSMWIADNIPRYVDIIWFKEGGGFIKSKHAPAGRFNAGEKLVFWFALAGGAAVIVTGLFLLFPFYVTDIAGMQLAHVIHAVVAVFFIAVILGHIYIGTLGMEGAFEAMGKGTVDENWAKEHHSLWYEEQAAHGGAPQGPGPAPVRAAE